MNAPTDGDGARPEPSHEDPREDVELDTAHLIPASDDGATADVVVHVPTAAFAPAGDRPVFLPAFGPTSEEIERSRSGWVLAAFFVLAGTVVVAALFTFLGTNGVAWGFLLGVVVALIPTAAFYYALFRRNDRDKASAAVFSKLFLMGMIAAVPAIIIESLLSIAFLVSAGATFVLFASFSVFCIAGGTEESLKYFVTRHAARLKQPALWHSRGCIIYGMAAALGFATIENLGYVLGTFMSAKSDAIASLLIVGVIRALLTVPMHALCGMLIGDGFAMRFYSRREMSFWAIVRLPIVVHSTFNAIILILGSLRLYVLALCLNAVLVIALFVYFFKRVYPRSVSATQPFPSPKTCVPVFMTGTGQPDVSPAAPPPLQPAVVV